MHNRIFGSLSSITVNKIKDFFFKFKCIYIMLNHFLSIKLFILNFCILSEYSDRIVYVLLHMKHLNRIIKEPLNKHNENHY